MKTEPGPG